uniref:Uncharacterized protein n=1 Tax=Arundo donax TaxID=35708 RepID=A0A0A8ZGQ8_ARUDO
MCLVSSCFTRSRAMLIAPVLSDNKGVGTKLEATISARSHLNQ